MSPLMIIASRKQEAEYHVFIRVTQRPFFNIASDPLLGSGLTTKTVDIRTACQTTSSHRRLHQ